MRYFLALLAVSFFFCSSPTDSNKTDSGKQPFEVCVSGFNTGWVQVYVMGLQGNTPIASGAMLAKVLDGKCIAVDVPDGTTLIAIRYIPPNIKLVGQDETIIAHAGDYWNL